MYEYPFGNDQRLNLDWFLAEWKNLLAAWEAEKNGIDGALDAEIARAEAALADVFAARDAAAQSAANALESKNAAAQSASDASGYLSTVQQNATAAQNAAQSAGQSEANALASKNAAAQSEANALASKNAAAQSEANALASKNAATQSETAAGNSASAAAQSQTAAGNSASAAAQSAEDAEDAAASVEASAEQITTNTNDIADLKTNTNLIQEPIITPFLNKKFSAQATGRTVSVNNNVFKASGTGSGSNYTGIFIGQSALSITNANSTNIRAFIENHLDYLIPINTDSALLLSMFLKSGNGYGKVIGLYACTDTTFIAGQVINLNTFNINHLLYTLPSEATKICLVVVDQTPAIESEIVFNVQPFPNINTMLATMLENN